MGARWEAPLNGICDDLIDAEDVVRGVLLKSAFSSARRVVLSVEDSSVWLQAPDGRIETLPLRVVCRSWRQIGTVTG